MRLAIRRLHSLTGVLPIGAFLLEHLYSNYQAVGPGGRARFDGVVKDLQHNPFVIWLEIFAIGLPILYHAIVGLVITAEARPNVARVPRAANWRYTLQRLSGVILVAYIGYHVYMTRLFPIFFPRQFPSGLVTYDYMHGYLTSVHAGVPIWGLYIIGITAAVYHFANGLWGFLIHWGITVGPRAQRASAWACAALGVGLYAIGLAGLYAFVNVRGAGIL
jgi:succinate dehydrogenase / fumarate reductase cytochrome b subunit